MATTDAPEAEDLPETRERQVSSYDDLNGLTFGALKRLASDNGIKLAKFPKKHDIIKQILIQAEDDPQIASSIVAAVPNAPHVSNPPSPRDPPVRQSSQQAMTEEKQPARSPSKRRAVGFAPSVEEKSSSSSSSGHGRTESQIRRAAARQRSETHAVMSDTRRNQPRADDPNKPPLKSSRTVGDVMRPRHRPRASSLPTRATLDTAELYAMNFTQLKAHALTLGLEIPRVPTRGKILKMILAYQPDDLDVDEDSESEDAVKGDEKEEDDGSNEVEETPPAEVPAAPAAEAIVHEENKPSDLMAMWRQRSQDSNGSKNRSASPSTEDGSRQGKKSNLMSMWQERADADKTASPTSTSPGPSKKRGGGKVSKFAERFANQNIPVGGAAPKRTKSPSQSRQATPSTEEPPAVAAESAAESVVVEEKKEEAAPAEPSTPASPLSPAPAEEAEAPAAAEFAATDTPATAAAADAADATEEKKEEAPPAEAAAGPPVKTREELDAMGFKALKKYITNDLGLSLPRVPNRANCIKMILKHQSGETDDEPKKKIKLKPKPKPSNVASEIGGTSIADRLKMIAASQANHGVPPPGGGGSGAAPASGPKKIGRIGNRFEQQDNATDSKESENGGAPVDARPKPRKKKKIGKVGGMGMMINVAALRPGFRPKQRARSSSMVTTQMEFQNLELLRPTIQSGRRKSRIKGPGRSDAASRILVEEDED